MVLLDSLVAQRANGDLIIGRVVPDAWVRDGKVISLANVPTAGGRHSGLTVTLAPTTHAVTVQLAHQKPAS